jgi:hypothetical protein
MKRLFCVALLCAVGCTSVPVAEPAPAVVDPAPVVAVNGDHNEPGLARWIPGIFADLWEVLDARIGLDYGLGAHLKFTDLARIGIFDYSDFSLIGVDSEIFHGEYTFPDMAAWTKNGSWDFSAAFGVGLGAEFAFHTWEFFDFVSSIVGLGYWSLNDD